MPSRDSKIKSFLAAALLFSLAGGGLSAQAADFPPETSDLKIMNELLESAFDAYVDENYDQAVLNFQHVLQMNPSDKTAQQGMKQSRKMLETKRKAIQSNEKDKLRLAQKFMKLEKWLDAIDQIAAVLLLNPNNHDALEIQNKISTLCREKMSDPKAPPGNDMIYQAILHYLNKRYDEAIKLLREAAAPHPNDF